MLLDFPCRLHKWTKSDELRIEQYTEIATSIATTQRLLLMNDDIPAAIELTVDSKVNFTVLGLTIPSLYH
jgi:agmatine/peptidylarginine deiminase